ncbi:sugar phosphate nucleotidyltransferase, partial [Klebsiella pneumoniae]|uniref:sugar phosphate nucleotidyltransferase n=1 Tax=Klebsiella pneumoniae TaxID=573 RepID=UPI0027309609
PETGYGYIKSTADSLLPEGVSRVEQFVEKPNEKRAVEFVKSGGYFWNSGMFLFRASRFLEELKKPFLERWMRERMSPKTVLGN